MEQYLHGAKHALQVKFALSQHCSSSDFNPSDIILTALFNFFVMYLIEIIVHFTKLYFRDQLIKKKLTSKVYVAYLWGATVYIHGVI